MRSLGMGGRRYSPFLFLERWIGRMGDVFFFFFSCMQIVWYDVKIQPSSLMLCLGKVCGDVTARRSGGRDREAHVFVFLIDLDCLKTMNPRNPARLIVLVLSVVFLINPNRVQARSPRNRAQLAVLVSSVPVVLRRQTIHQSHGRQLPSLYSNSSESHDAVEMDEL